MTRLINLFIYLWQRGVDRTRRHFGYAPYYAPPVSCFRNFVPLELPASEWSGPYLYKLIR